MPDLKVPIVAADDSPEHALNLMKIARRSVVLVKGRPHSLVYSSDIADAIGRNVRHMHEIRGTRIAPGARDFKGNLLKLKGSLLKVHEESLPLFESSPQVCRCDENGHIGWSEGAKCTEPGCHGTVHCQDV